MKSINLHDRNARESTPEAPFGLGEGIWLTVLLQLAKAVAKLEQDDIAHRCIRPETVFVEEDGGHS